MIKPDRQYSGRLDLGGQHVGRRNEEWHLNNDENSGNRRSQRNPYEFEPGNDAKSIQ